MQTDQQRNIDDDNTGKPQNGTSGGGPDLTDSASDRARLRPEEATLDLPDVKDIPGQEFVHVPPMGDLADVTISSADEEGIVNGDDSLDSDDDTEIVMGTEADITADEKRMLENADNYMPTHDDDRLQQAALDNTDEDGELLNESGFGEDLSGSDLDVPGAEDDDDNEAIGEEDEENNNYSLDEENEDQNTEGIP